MAINRGPPYCLANWLSYRSLRIIRSLIVVILRREIVFLSPIVIVFPSPALFGKWIFLISFYASIVLVLARCTRS